jgi:hypothetical protein
MRCMHAEDMEIGSYLALAMQRNDASGAARHGRG